MSESPLTGKVAKARYAKYRDAALKGIAGKTKRPKKAAKPGKKTDGVSNIRYGTLGQVVFEYRGKTYKIKEPDVILVGTDRKLASAWIILNYGYLLKS